jgi:hypothetical protein
MSAVRLIAIASSPHHVYSSPPHTVPYHTNTPHTDTDTYPAIDIYFWKDLGLRIQSGSMGVSHTTARRVHPPLKLHIIIYNIRTYYFLAHPASCSLFIYWEDLERRVGGVAVAVEAPPARRPSTSSRSAPGGRCSCATQPFLYSSRRASFSRSHHVI